MASNDAKAHRKASLSTPGTIGDISGTLIALAADTVATASRVAAVGKLLTSTVQDINQPLSAIVIGAETTLLGLGAETPNLDEARQALARVVRDGRRATDAVSRALALIKRGAATDG